jgi:beta-ribofuranosylaminobenzene 5'-phosphate synthase
MTRVVAPARLHFGLLRTSPDPVTGHFGGCGLMIDQPQTIVTAELSDTWIASGPDAERALAFAQRVTSQCHNIVVEQVPPAHCGLGTGTALALAVGKAVAPQLATTELARLTGRGGRSRVGLTGFDTGGFVSESYEHDTAISFLWPRGWRVLVLVPEIEPRWHGSVESDAFQQLTQTLTTSAVQMELEDLLEAMLLERRHRSSFTFFSDALFKYNRISGGLFQEVQGGHYAHPVIASLVDELRLMGVVGVGQSSWGPGVFAICQSEAEAQRVFTAIEPFTPWRYRTITTGAKSGAVITPSSRP